MQKIRIRGVLYKNNCYQKGIGNSFVIYQLPGENVLWAGQICNIFLHWGTFASESPPLFRKIQLFLAIKEFLSLTAEDSTRDPFNWYFSLHMRPIITNHTMHFTFLSLMTLLGILHPLFTHLWQLEKSASLSKSFTRYVQHLVCSPVKLLTIQLNMYMYSFEWISYYNISWDQVL